MASLFRRIQHTSSFLNFHLLWCICTLNFLWTALSLERCSWCFVSLLWLFKCTRHYYTWLHINLTFCFVLLLWVDGRLGLRGEVGSSTEKWRFLLTHVHFIFIILSNTTIINVQSSNTWIIFLQFCAFLLTDCVANQTQCLTLNK